MIEEVIPTWTSGSMEEIGREKCSEIGHLWITIEIDLKENVTPEMSGVKTLHAFLQNTSFVGLCIVCHLTVSVFTVCGVNCIVCGINLRWPFLLSLGHPQAHLVLLSGIERGM